MSKATILIEGVVGVDSTLVDVISQFTSYNEPTEIEVIIDSVGGYVAVGNSINAYLNGLGLPISTVAIKAYSIAASIFINGDEGKRSFASNAVAQPFMIHPPLAQNVTGGAELLEGYAAQLREIKAEFVELYSTKLPNIPADTLEDLISNETYLTAEEAVSLGFANFIEEPLKAVAMLNEPEQLNKNTFMNELKKQLSAIIARLSGLELTDGTNDSVVDFYELEEGETPSVGDKARVDGVDAEGEIVMPSGETFVFGDGGELSEIKPKEEEESEDPDSEAAPAEQNETVEAEAAEISEVIKWEISVVNDSFALGDKVEYKPAEGEEDPTGVSAGEYELEDGRKILVDGDSIIQFIKESPAQADPVEESDSEVAAQAIAALEIAEKKLEDQAAEIAALKQAQSSADIDEPISKPTKSWDQMTALERRRASK